MSGYIGSQPADSFLSISSQQISGNGGATYTLNSNVTNPEDVAVFVNNVRQNVNTYSVSNNQITLGGTIASSDSCYVVFLGKTLATVNPPSGSVGLTQLSATGTKNNTTFLRGDNTFATPSGGANTPAFLVFQSSNQSISNTTSTILQFGTENIDTDNAYSSNRFTVPNNKGGLYHFTFNLQMNGNISGTAIGIQRYNSSGGRYTSGGGNFTGALNMDFTALAFSNSCILELNATDYVEVTLYHNSGSTKTTYAPNTWFGGYKLIT